MSSFSVDRVVKRFAEYQPLQRRMLEATKITVAIDAPTQRKMIEYNMIAIVDRNAVRTCSCRLVFITETNTKISGDNMAAIFNTQVSVRKRYSFAWGGLPCNSKIRFTLNLYILFQSDHAADIKDYRAWPFDGFDPFPE